MKRLRRGLHYRTKLSLTLCGIVLIPVIVTLILYYSFIVGYNHQEQLDRCNSWLIDGVVYIQETVDDVLDEMDRFETDEGQFEFLRNPIRYDMTQKVDIAKTNRNILSAITELTNEQIAQSVRVYGQRIMGDMIAPGPMYPLELLGEEHPDILGAFQNSDREYIYRVESTGSGETLQSAESSVLAVYQAVRDMRGSLIAVNAVAFPFSYFAEELTASPFENCFLIYEATGEPVILLRSGGNGLSFCAGAYTEYLSGSQTDRTKDCFVLSSDLLFSAGMEENGRSDRVYLFIPEAQITMREDGFLFNTLLITLVAILLIVIVIRIVSWALTKRLYQLLADISADNEKLISGRQKLQTDEFDEFGWIRAKFGDVVAEVQDYSSKVMRAEYEQRVLKAELMQDLIAPHFLYNTLDGLRWSTDDPNLIRVIDHMVNFYRLALNKGEPFVTITQELEMVESYLEVQAFSYESEFRHEINVPDSLREVRILKHILQPILENSLVHGIDKRGDHGLIRISAWEEDGLLQIEIWDNGAGMTDEKIAQLMEGSSNTGYGIHNVIQRIALFYGKEYGLRITSAPDQGTTVHVTLPLHQPGEREEDDTAENQNRKAE